MDDLATLIPDLDDATAKRILATVAQQRLRSGATADVPATAETARDLAAAVAVAPDAASVSEGDVARQSLLLIADDPAMQPVLRNLIEYPSAQKFADPTMLIVGAAALVVLQSYMEIERDKNGKWTFKLKKKPLNDSLLKEVIQKLAGYLGVK